ncbi:MAG: choice-of-anchor tandem repeat GloVer-containing protein [Bryobacteraceae bacterium]
MADLSGLATFIGSNFGPDSASPVAVSTYVNPSGQNFSFTLTGSYNGASISGQGTGGFAGITWSFSSQTTLGTRTLAVTGTETITPTSSGYTAVTNMDLGKSGGGVRPDNVLINDFHVTFPLSLESVSWIGSASNTYNGKQVGPYWPWTCYCGFSNSPASWDMYANVPKPALPNGATPFGVHLTGTVPLLGGNGAFVATIAQIASNTLTTLYSFSGGSDGANPNSSPVALGSGGVLYGTTTGGGTAGLGTVFSLTPPAAAGGAWTEAVLYSFQGAPSDGGNPDSGVAIGENGVLYGTTHYGGPENYGTVFSLTPPASPGGAWTKATVYNFQGGANDGSFPYASVVIAKNGALYGTTQAGGPSNAGTVFSLKPPASPGGAWTEAVLHSFTGGADGANPFAGVTRDSAGNLYGATYNGGAANAGVVYKVDKAGAETVLYSFAGEADGGNPFGGVIFDSAGNLYGTTSFGGTAAGGGVVYKLDAAGQETVLYSFCALAGCADGATPQAGVIRDSKGNLYGTTWAGGATGYGVVYELSTAGAETLLYNFTGGADGGSSLAPVIRDSTGKLYGATEDNTFGGAGTVFSLSK